MKVDLNAIPTLEETLNKQPNECNYIDGIAMAKTALLIAPKDPNFHFYLACFYAAVDRNDNALRHLKKAIVYGLDEEVILTAHSLQGLQSDERFKKLLNSKF